MTQDKGKMMKPPADATHCGGYPMTIDIARLRELLDKATPGPWAWLDKSPNDRLFFAARNALPDLLDALAAKDAEIVRLRELVQSVLDACDKGRMVAGGVGGMTIEANIRGSFYNGVPAWPIEEARAALEDTP